MTKRRRNIELPGIKADELHVMLPFNLGFITFVPDEVQEEAAWQLYVELATRVTLQSLKRDDGLMREALSSIYKLFPETRRILKDAGPAVGRTKRGEDTSFGQIAIDVLNVGLRPFMSKWHPRLLDYENRRPPDVSEYDHEQAWEHIEQMRTELDVMREQLQIYASALALMAGIEEKHNG